MKQEDFFRVNISRRVHEDGRDKWVRVVQDGVVIDRRHGANGGWIRVVAPGAVEERPINRDPNNAEWFPLLSRAIHVVVTGGPECPPASST